jgi:pimeloyl-ACP methyl ester carboxylesterase
VKNKAQPNSTRQVIPPAPGKLVAVGGARMHAIVKGTGTATVILESGAGGSVLEWSMVAEALSAEATVVTRDRPGFAWSDYVKRDRSAVAAAQDMRELLQALGKPGPYVLVGHSLGGLHVLAYAMMFPKEVAGVVLVDSAHDRAYEGQWVLRSMLQVMRGLILLRPILGKRFVRDTYFRMLTSGQAMPTQMEPILALFSIMDEANGPWFKGMYDEFGSVIQSAHQVTELRRLAAFPRVPVRIISQGLGLKASSPHKAMFERLVALHAELCCLSPNSQHHIAEQSGHMVQLDQPSLVVDTILEVLRQPPPREQANFM